MTNMVKFVGQKAQLITVGERIQGHEVVDYQDSYRVRSGDEQIVDAPKGSKCIGSHALKGGQLVFDLGPKSRGIGNSYACARHYNALPTFELVKHRLERDPLIVSGILRDVDTGDILFAKPSDLDTSEVK